MINCVKGKNKTKNDQKEEGLTLGDTFPNSNNFKSFSRGLKLRSKQKTLPLHDLLRTETLATTWFMDEKTSLVASLCLLMCPPKAWPREKP